MLLVDKYPIGHGRTSHGILMEAPPILVRKYNALIKDNPPHGYISSVFTMEGYKFTINVYKNKVYLTRVDNFDQRELYDLEVEPFSLD